MPTDSPEAVDDAGIEAAVAEGVVTIRELSRFTTQVFKALERRGRPILVTRRGKVVASIAPTTMREVVDTLVARDTFAADAVDVKEALSRGETVDATELPEDEPGGGTG